jgi:hypothetical protein
MRCIWCNRSQQSLIEVVVPIVNRFGGDVADQTFQVHPEHEQEFRRFSAIVVQRGRAFIVGVLAISTLMLTLATVSMLIQSRRMAIMGTSACTILLSLALMRWPFATPETVGTLGVKQSVAVVRVLAIGLLAFGVAMVIFML